MIERPLIYVDQPNFPIPKRSMQEEYHSTDQLSVVDQEEKLEELNLTSKKVKENKDKKSNESSGEKSFKRTEQVFKEMTIDEKIDYLIKPSKFLPKMSCKISINQQNYHGKILKREGKQITFIGTHTLKQDKFDIAEIETIEIVGF